jgi:hypothetical protein
VDRPYVNAVHSFCVHAYQLVHTSSAREECQCCAGNLLSATVARRPKNVLLLLLLLLAAFTLINRSLLKLAGISFLDLAKVDVFHERGLETSERFIDCNRST